MDHIHLNGGEHAVMLLYGLSGSPLEIIYLATKLNEEGYSVEIPHIPGYEHSVQGEIIKPHEFWVNSAIDYFHQMKRKYKSVSIGGLSAGAVLCLRLAELVGNEVSALILLSTTLYTDGWSIPWYQVFLPLLYFSPFRYKLSFKESEPFGIKNLERRAIASKGMTENAVSITGGSAISLFKLYQARQLNHLVIKNLSLITCPTLVIHAVEDDTASLKNMELVLANISSPFVKQLTLQDSYHIITVDNEKEKVVQSCIDFLQQALLDG
ncbi:alpha/beta hydrolase [Legionella fallonii]|nr:alpha/beta fold hydrolase [Legionella fallonii]